VIARTRPLPPRFSSDEMSAITVCQTALREGLARRRFRYRVMRAAPAQLASNIPAHLQGQDAGPPAVASFQRFDSRPLHP
jgi:hypothetical protein